jgi:hypothetical protein
MEDVAKIERDAACEGCGASTSRGIEQDAITAWNTRQPTHSNLHKTQSAAEQSFAENANKSTGQERQPTQSEALKIARAHIEEHITFAETRIQDGKELGATVWRIALEDMAKESREVLAALEQSK